MKIKVSEATNSQLDYLAAKVLDLPIEDGVVHTGEFYWDEEGLQWEVEWSPTTNWAQGGQIIECEEIDVYCYESPKSGCGWWVAEITGTKAKAKEPTPLIAAMRCLVVSKLGNEVEVPDELA